VSTNIGLSNHLTWNLETIPGEIEVIVTALGFSPLLTTVQQIATISCAWMICQHVPNSTTFEKSAAPILSRNVSLMVWSYSSSELTLIGGGKNQMQRGVQAFVLERFPFAFVEPYAAVAGLRSI